MLDKLHRTIAKEIIDQTLSHFKKQQRLDATREQSSIPKVELRSEESYEPSANFHRVFSGIIGEKSSANENIKSENQLESLSKTSYPQNFSRNEPADYENYGKQQEEETPRPQIEGKLDKPPMSPVSVFKRPSHEQKEEENTSPQIENKSDRQSTSSVSVFKKLSQGASQ